MSAASEMVNHSKTNEDLNQSKIPFIDEKVSNYHKQNRVSLCLSKKVKIPFENKSVQVLKKCGKLITRFGRFFDKQLTEVDRTH
jgi:hypothetical protein